jgi:hypothetical protein
VPNRRGALIASCAVVLGGWTGWVSGFPRASPAAVSTWVISLACVLVVDALFWRGRSGRKPGLRLVPALDHWPRPGRGGWRRALAGVSLWIGLSVVTLAWEILGIDTGKRAPHLTISSLTTEFRPLHAALLLVWMLVGCGYGAARARAPIGTQTGKGRGLERGHTSALASGNGWHALSAPALLLPASNPVGLVFWIAIAVTAVALDQIGRRSGGRWASAEELVRFTTTDRVVNASAIVVWTYAGYHLFAH